MDLSKYISKLPVSLNINADTNRALAVLKIYSFYEYYGGDENEVEELNDCIFFSREHEINFDAVFYNSNLDEDIIDVIFSLSNYNLSCSTKDILSYFIKLKDILIKQIVNRNFSNSFVLGAIEKINDYLEYFEDNAQKICIKILLENDNFSKEDKKALLQEITNLSTREKYNDGGDTKYIDISFDIIYGKDIEDSIISNIYPYSYVENGKLVIDKSFNYLTYEDNSVVCSISAQSLKDLYSKEGNKGLLAMNLRYHITGKNVDNQITNSILNDYENFWYLNNGIIIVCKDFNIIGNELRLSNFSIVNGGQTTFLIGTTDFYHDFYLTCKVVKTKYHDDYKNNEFIAKVAEASNTQKPINAKDLISNRPELRTLKDDLSKIGVPLEIKRGEKSSGSINTKLKINTGELSQSLYAFFYLEPGSARNGVSKLLTNSDKYKKIYQDYKFSRELIKNIIFIKKFYEKAKLKVKRDDSKQYGADYKNLFLNGYYYALSLLGFLLKVKYNNAYKEDLLKYFSNQDELIIRAKHIAFNHQFLDSGITITDFIKEKEVYKLFDRFFVDIIIPTYSNEVSNRPSLIYSNWLKTNVGFELRVMIKTLQFIRDEDIIIKGIFRIMDQIFINIDENQEKENENLYLNDHSLYLKEKSDAESIKTSIEKKIICEKLKKCRKDIAESELISEDDVFNDEQLNTLVEKGIGSYDDLKNILSKDSFENYGNYIARLFNSRFVHRNAISLKELNQFVSELCEENISTKEKLLKFRKIIAGKYGYSVNFVLSKKNIEKIINLKILTQVDLREYLPYFIFKNHANDFYKIITRNDKDLKYKNSEGEIPEGTYTYSGTNIYNELISATMEFKDGQFIVKKGAKVSSSVTSIDINLKRIREKSLSPEFITEKDCIFLSSSAAASFVTGRRTNGRTFWKDRLGRVIDYYRKIKQ